MAQVEDMGHSLNGSNRIPIGNSNPSAGGGYSAPVQKLNTCPILTLSFGLSMEKMHVLYH